MNKGKEKSLKEMIENKERTTVIGLKTEREIERDSEKNCETSSMRYFLKYGKLLTE